MNYLLIFTHNFPKFDSKNVYEIVVFPDPQEQTPLEELCAEFPDVPSSDLVEILGKSWGFRTSLGVL